MDLLRRNYDLVATAITGTMFLAMDVPAWLWWAYGALVVAQLGNRIINGWSR